MTLIQTSLPPDLPDPPQEYDPVYMSRVLDLLSQALFALSMRRPIIGTTINLSRLPTSATGLRTGDLWNDGGTVRIV